MVNSQSTFRESKEMSGATQRQPRKKDVPNSNKKQFESSGSSRSKVSRGGSKMTSKAAFNASKESHSRKNNRLGDINGTSRNKNNIQIIGMFKICNFSSKHRFILT